MSDDLIAAMQPGMDATVSMPDGSTITGGLIEVQWHSPPGDAIYCDFKIETEEGYIISASMSHKDAVAGAPPKAKSVSKPYYGVDFGSKTAYPIIGSGSFEVEVSEEQKQSFMQADLSQIVADIEKLKQKEPSPSLSIGAKHSIYDQLMSQHSFVAAYGKHALKKPLADTLLDLVKEIGHELQKASEEELKEVLKQPVMGMNVALVPKLSLTPIGINEPPSPLNTIKVLHIRLEVSE